MALTLDKAIVCLELMVARRSSTRW